MHEAAFLPVKSRPRRELEESEILHVLEFEE